MKVLLCTFTVGEGLNKICSALAEQLTKLDIENEIFDVFKDNKKMQFSISKRYYNLVKIFPRALRFFQNKLCRYDRKLKPKKPNYFVNQEVEPIKKIVSQKLQQGDYDVIFTPVVSIAIALTQLKKQGITKAKIIYNIPDFNLPINIEQLKDIDYIITDCEEQEKTLLDFGFDKSQLVMNKIPIAEKFLTSQPKDVVRKELGLEDKFTVLIMSGGYGAESNLKVLKTFVKYNSNIQYIVVNGRNKKEFDKINNYIQKKNIKNVLNLGFCTYVDKLMTVADVLYTKVGAATLCESFAKNLIIVTKKQLLYPEYANLKHLKKHNSALECKNLKECAKTIKKIQNNEINLNEIQTNLKNILNTNSAQLTANLIIQLKK